MLGLWVVMIFIIVQFIAMKIKIISILSIIVSAQESEKHNIYYIHNGQQRP